MPNGDHDAFNPIGDVGRSLRSLLQEGMGTWSVGDDQIALASPEQFEPDAVGLSIHLYHLREDPHRRNEPERSTDPGAPAELPLVLELYYLVTAHPPNGETVDTSDTLEQHRMLSKAIQTFREEPVISGSSLEGDFPPGTELHVDIDTEATDHVMDVWGSFRDTPYLPSISYVVSPVVIETADADAQVPVNEATMEHYGSGS